MALASGLGAQLGAIKESTYGTYVTPTRFFEFDSDAMNRKPNYIESQGLRANAMFQTASRVVQTTREATGSVQLDVPSVGFSFWLDLLHSLTVTPAQFGTNAAYSHQHLIGTSQASKSATVQIAKPDTGGVARPFSYLGCMVPSLDFSMDNAGTLKGTINLDAQDEITSQALASASYPTNIHSYNFTGGTVTLNGASLGVVKSLSSLSIANPLNTGRYFFGSSGLKGKPIPNAFMTVTGTLTVEFADLTAYNLFVSGAMSQIVFDFTSGFTLGTTTALSTPAAPTLTPSSSGGTLATGSYQYRISALNAAGETLAGPEAGAPAAVTGPTGSVAISWTAIPNASGYRVYGRTASGETLLATTTTNAYTDTGALTPNSVALPSGNTTGSALPERIRFSMPAAQFRGDSPNVAGPEVLELQVPFQAFNDGGSNNYGLLAPLVIDYNSTDSAV
jgi:hypothetical protein